MTRSQEFIAKNRKKLSSGADYYNPDSVLMPLEEFEKRSIKFLLIMPSPSEVKTVSSTLAAINDFVISNCPNVFVDFAYYPSKEDIKHFDKAKIPYGIGMVTHLDASHFDMVGFSISVLSEVITTPVIINSFQRCDIPIPLTWSERKKMKLGTCPILYAGGITAVCGDVMYGELGDGRKAFLDFTYLGSVEKLDFMFDKWSLMMNTLNDIHTEEHPNIQQYINTLFESPHYYQPQSYRVVFNDKNQIIENTKINPHAQDFVRPYYPHVLPDDIGIGRTYISASGDNAGVSQTQVSEGCSASGSCSFCHEGNYTGGWVEKSHDRILKEALESKKYSAAYKYKPYSFNCNYITDYKGMLYKLMKIYPKVTFINMRLEELGRDTDALLMMKLIGSNRISAPIEGISPRIQNNLLNKNLSLEALENFMTDLIHLKMTDIKVGGIFTAYEEDEDFQWIVDFVSKLKKRALAEGGNLPFRLKMCLTKDALTPIQGRGLITQDLIERGSIASHRGALVSGVTPQGITECYKLVTKEGYSITGTPNHPVLTEPKYPDRHESFKFIKDLKEGDEVYIKVGSECYGEYFKTISHDIKLMKRTRGSEIKYEYTLSEDMAEVFGWFTGDGYISSTDNRRVGLCYNLNELDILDKHKITLERLGIKPKINKYKSIHKLCINNIAFTTKIRELFGHRFDGKKVPSCILESPKSVQEAYLRGLFSSDGTIGSYGKYKNQMIRLSVSNKPLIKQVQIMLANMGIFSNIDRTSKGRKSVKYTLKILNAHRALFSKIGFVGFKSLISIKRFCRSNTRLISGFYKATVKIAEQVADEKTYGFTIDSGTYVTNGILSHNTPLVHYQLTPVEYIERKSGKKSYEGTHWLTDEWYAKFQEAGIFFKVNGFRYSTFMEQCVIDLGRTATSLFYNLVIKEMKPVYSLRSFATDDVIKGLKKLVNKEYFFETRDPDNYISLSHRIHIELMGSYMPRALRLVEAQKNGDIFATEPDLRCLKTFDEAKTKCMAKVLVNNPMPIRNDVLLTKEGLQGDSRPLIGCERCPTVEQRKARLQRPTPQTKNSDDIVAAPRLPQVQKIRFIIQRNEGYDLLNPNNTAHTFLAKYLQQSDRLLDYYHSVSGHSMFWQSDGNQPYVTSGIQVVDTIWSENVLAEVRSLVGKVNSNLKSTKVIGVKDELMDEKIKVDDFNIYYFESSLPYELFESSRFNYSHEVRIKTGMDLMEVRIDKTLIPPVFASRGKVSGFFAVPLKYNPLNYLQGFFNKKLSINKVVEGVTLKAMMTVRGASNVCKMCGKEKSTISLITGTPIAMGVRCLTNALLTQKVKQHGNISSNS